MLPPPASGQQELSGNPFTQKDVSSKYIRVAVFVTHEFPVARLCIELGSLFFYHFRKSKKQSFDISIGEPPVGAGFKGNRKEKHFFRYPYLETKPY